MGRTATQILVATLTVLGLFAASAAEAHKGFYAGGGLTGQSVSGGLDGKRAYINDEETVEILAGKPSTGAGIGFNLGYQFTSYIGVDFMALTTSHTATHSAVTDDSPMTLSTTWISARFTYPWSEQLEFFGRVGVTSAQARADKFTLHGDVANGNHDSVSEVEFMGSGFGAGAGFQWFVKKVGIGASLNMATVDFKQVHAAGSTKEVKPGFSSTITGLTVMGVYYFN